jgi:ribosomal protein L14E/L6E/L27E
VSELLDTNELTIGQFVRSEAGRDKGRVFIIVEVFDDKYVIVADGDLRRIGNPKKKKVKHLSKYNLVSELIARRNNQNMTITNLMLRTEIDKLETDRPIE